MKYEYKIQLTCQSRFVLSCIPWKSHFSQILIHYDYLSIGEREQCSLMKLLSQKIKMTNIKAKQYQKIQKILDLCVHLVRCTPSQMHQGHALCLFYLNQNMVVLQQTNMNYNSTHLQQQLKVSCLIFHIAARALSL